MISCPRPFLPAPTDTHWMLVADRQFPLKPCKDTTSALVRSTSRSALLPEYLSASISRKYSNLPKTLHRDRANRRYARPANGTWHDFIPFFSKYF